MKKRGTHWTDKSTTDFVFRIGADFVAQVEAKLESGPFQQKELAQSLNVTEGAVSQTLNKPGNLKLETMINYARALGMKLSVILYEDGDPRNERGPIHADIFRMCWERFGRPIDFLSISATETMPVTVREWADLSKAKGHGGLVIVDDPSPWLEPVPMRLAVGGYHGRA